MTRSLQSAAKKISPPARPQQSSTVNDRIIIGRLGAPRGVNGEMKLIPLTDFADRFDSLEEVFIDDRIFRIDYVKAIGKGLAIRFDGVNDRDSARSLTNKLLTVDRKDAAPLADGEFYAFDIIGLDVIDLDNQKLGNVKNVLKTGSNDVFVVVGADGREILIPALKAVVKKIDIDGGSMVVDAKMLEAV